MNLPGSESRDLKKTISLERRSELMDRRKDKSFLTARTENKCSKMFE